MEKLPEYCLKNDEIIELEKKDSALYRRTIEEQLSTKKNELNVHQTTIPLVISAPQENEDTKRTTIEITQKITQNRDIIKSQQDEILLLQSKRNTFSFELNELKSVKASILNLENYIESSISQSITILEKYNLRRDSIFKYHIDTASVDNLITEKGNNLLELEPYFIPNTPLNPNSIITNLESEIKELQDKLDGDSKEYQQYLNSVQEWEKRKDEIIGSIDKEGSLKYYQNIKEYLDVSIESEILKCTEERNILLRKILDLKKTIANVYKELYKPVSDFISFNKNQLSDYNVNIDVALGLNEFESKFFRYIANNTAGSFYGSSESRVMLQKITEIIDFDNLESVIEWVKSIVNHLHFDKREGQNNTTKKVLRNQLKGESTDKEFYDFLFFMDYYEPNYQLKLGEKTLSELSPGERGALLLIFYLLLDKQDIPIIIDQPEENLDNQSVYKILVHFIKKAKERRQIIIVTHNPNIAVVCDAEQVIRMDIAKDGKNKVSMITGGIENPEINRAIVNILEGTRPAFNNRTFKYQVSNT